VKSKTEYKNMRVIQRNVVYVLGLAPSIAFNEVNYLSITVLVMGIDIEKSQSTWLVWDNK